MDAPPAGRGHAFGALRSLAEEDANKRPMLADAETMQVLTSGDSPAAPPAGCHFHPRCGDVKKACLERYPDSVEVGVGHTTRCHLYGK